MKKLFQKINNKTLRSIVFGLILAFVINTGTAIVNAAPGQLNPIEAVTVPLLGPSTKLLSKIGSLTVGASSSASWITPQNECTTSERVKSNTCLDVSGSGSFGYLVIKQTANILGNLTISAQGTYTGSAGLLGIASSLIIEDSGRTDDGILVQGLGRTNGLGVFDPLNTSNEREICAATDGTLTIC